MKSKEDKHSLVVTRKGVIHLLVYFVRFHRLFTNDFYLILITVVGSGLGDRTAPRSNGHLLKN